MPKFLATIPKLWESEFEELPPKRDGRRRWVHRNCDRLEIVCDLALDTPWGNSASINFTVSYSAPRGRYFAQRVQILCFQRGEDLAGENLAAVDLKLEVGLGFATHSEGPTEYFAAVPVLFRGDPITPKTAWIRVSAKKTLDADI
jgi:hypothetical protein